MPDAVSHIGREGTFDALGRTWRHSRWTRGVWVEISRRAREVLPDPRDLMLKVIDQLELKEVEVMRAILRADQEEERKARDEKRAPVLMAHRYRPTADFIAERAQEKAGMYLNFHSPEVQSYVLSPEGGAFLFYLLLREHQPDVTEDTAHDVVVALGPAQVREVMDRAQGVAPPTNGDGKKKESPPPTGG